MQECAIQATDYFRRVVQPKRPYATDDIVKAILADPIQRVQQVDGRWRHWGKHPNGRFMRVVTEADGNTVHTAFYDRRFTP